MEQSPLWQRSASKSEPLLSVVSCGGLGVPYCSQTPWACGTFFCRLPRHRHLPSLTAAVLPGLAEGGSALVGCMSVAGNLNSHSWRFCRGEGKSAALPGGGGVGGTLCLSVTPGGGGEQLLRLGIWEKGE